MLRFSATAFFSAVFLALLVPTVAEASKCVAYVDKRPRAVLVSDTPVQAVGEVEVTYVGHSTFRMKTPAGVVIATDYAGYAGPGALPNVVTMNHAHETHFTAFPDPEIDHVLRGWNPNGGPAEHKLTVADVLIRNIPTDIRNWSGAVERDGNSIFVFEVADLCIGHLGHLHHKPTAEQLATIGRLDVVFAPVDGSYTLDLPSMIEVLQDLRASLVIPMHYFGGDSLKIFLAGMVDFFAIQILHDTTTEVSLRSLPEQPTVRVLAGP